MLKETGGLSDATTEGDRGQGMLELGLFRKARGHRASLVAQLVKNRLQCRRPQFDSWVRRIPWRKDRLPIPVFRGFSTGSDCKESACNVGDLGLIPELGRSPEEGHGNPLQYSCLENLLGQRSLVGYSPWGCKESGMSH